MRPLATCLTVVILVTACRDEPEESRSPHSDSIAPIGTGTELLLTRERLDLIEDWIRATIVRTGAAPASLEDIRPPDADAARYAPLGRFLRDGWGREIEYDYAPDTRSWMLRSAGPDGVVGTGDDVTKIGSQ